MTAQEAAIGAAFRMSRPCKCGSLEGRIDPLNGQDRCFCAVCGAWVYNVGKHETGKAVRDVTKIIRAGVDSHTRQRILIRDNFRCQGCGVTGNDTVLHVGHILSVNDAAKAVCDHCKGPFLSAEEVNDDSNFLTLCESCNLTLREHSLPPRAIALLIRVWREDGRAAIPRTARGGAVLREEGMASSPTTQPDRDGVLMR